MEKTEKENQVENLEINKIEVISNTKKPDPVIDIPAKPTTNAEKAITVEKVEDGKLEITYERKPSEIIQVPPKE